MEPHTKKLALIAAVMLMAFGLFIAVIEGSKALIKGGDPLLEQPNGVAGTATETRINHNGEILAFPAPEGYCFLDLSNELDKAAFGVMNNMQRTYGNHLWAVFADCKQLEAVRASKDLSTYIDTGMIVTPVQFSSVTVSAPVFVSTITEQIKKLDPVNLQDLVQENIKDNLSQNAEIKTGQPLIYGEGDKDALLFTITHDLSDTTTKQNFKLTEFDVVTAIKERPLLILFTYRDLADTTPRQDFTKSYLTTLRAAN